MITGINEEKNEEKKIKTGFSCLGVVLSKEKYKM